MSLSADSKESRPDEWGTVEGGLSSRTWLRTNTSPLGFKAGDTNLYRYVGNSPPNQTDATGEQATPAIPKPDKEGENPALSAAVKATALLRASATRDQMLRNRRVIQRVYSPKGGDDTPKGSRKAGAVSGKYHIWKTMDGIPNDVVVGFVGCDPCVGIILLPRKADRKTKPVIVIHVKTGKDDPQLSIIDAMNAAGLKNLKGYMALMGGAKIGDDALENRWVNYTFFYTVQQMRALGVGLILYHRTGTLYIDKHGDRFNGDPKPSK